MDWPALLAFAMRRFVLPPEVVWRLSLAEWRALTAPAGPAPLSRADFAALAAAHPDHRPREAL